MKAGTPILISENGDFRTRNIMGQELTYLEDTVILILSFLPITASNYVKQKFDRTEKHIYNLKL